ncbi:uncharacterized protein [Canis lupus baileyi]|uniref:uncharacterized protein n=1 Tax=Canis lupus baileyi TaxID=143281 RepID=UPI003B979F34
MRRTRSSRFVPQGLMGRYLRKSRGGGSEPPGCKHHQRPCPQGGKNSVDVTGLILPRRALGQAPLRSVTSLSGLTSAGGSPSPLSGVQASQTAHPLAVGELGFGNVGPAPRLLPPRHWLRGPGAGPSAQPPGWRQAPRAQFPGVGGGEAGASGRRLRGCSGQERPRPLPARSGLCLAFVESRFNISKGNENADGSFQINSHYWCNDDRSHSENICHEDCQDVLSLNLLSAISCAKKRLSLEQGGSMEVALCRPATLLLDDRMFLGMRQDTGLP